MLEEVIPGSIWVSERPVKFSGAWLRSRSTVVRLEDGALWLHSPAPPSEALCAALDELGPVRWLVVPNCFHHLAAPAAAARYPEARLVGPKKATERNKALALHLELEDPAFVEATSELQPVTLEGVPFLEETTFFHRPTGTLIAADLLISANEKDHWSWRFSARLFGRYRRNLTPPDVRFFTRASEAAARSIDRMAALPIERILVAHADPIVDRPVETLQEAWAFVRP